MKTSVNPVMLNMFGIILPDNEYLFYQMQNGKTTCVLNYKLIGDKIFFTGRDPVGILFDEKGHLSIAKTFGSDTGVKHRLSFFKPEISNLVLEEMAA